MPNARPASFAVAAILLCGLLSNLSPAQTEDATISGRVTDQSGAVVVGASVELQSAERGTIQTTTTNRDGIYLFSSVKPGVYHISLRKEGFHQVDYVGLTANVQAHIEQNFRLQVGSISESITVTADAYSVNTTDATVSTVVDRNFAENLPMNGRSFQTLIQLTPGVVLTANNGYDTGQFSVNGQRAASNYWMVDGVSANIGMSAGGSSGNGLGGALGSTSVLGGTNSLVSVDALQEFRVQTSTFAPEFGRTPGAQISIVTRSGTNEFHGTAFDYFRNDALDANDWFNGYTNNPPLPKARERQNDFGGTLGGPIFKNKTFFFFSYEGLRLRLPQTLLSFVPDASFTPGGTTNSRGTAAPALQPYLNAFPLPNPTSPEVLCDPATDPTCPPTGARGYAAFNASFSNPATLNAYSLRIDQKLRDKLYAFGRYNYSPSELTQRGGAGAALSSVSPTRITTQTGTVGVTWAISSVAANDLRFNYSSTDSSGSAYLDTFGGAVPLAQLPIPTAFTSRNSAFGFVLSSLGALSAITVGPNAHNHQRQLNLADVGTLQKGTHNLKFGVDFRRLSPQLLPTSYIQSVNFSDVPSAETGTLSFATIISSVSTTLLFRNLGVFGQDTWRVHPRLTLTYGFRWDVDFVPVSLKGPGFPAVVGFDLANLTNLALAPAGTKPYNTAYGNIAPRIGLAYQLLQSTKWQTLLRGGFGVFYDLATSEAGNTAQSFSYPFGSLKVCPFSAGCSGASTFPLSPEDAAPLPIQPPDATNFGALNAFDPKLRLPYTLQWNVAIEQSLGKEQSLTASYIGAAGRKLLQTASIFQPTPNISSANLVTNASTSDYDALQLQFRRQLSNGFQALASYTWSHSIDTASAGSIGNGSNDLSTLDPNINRGPSDVDIRHAISLGLTYALPSPRTNLLARYLISGWSIDSVIQARSAPPVDVYYAALGLSNGFSTNTRPDVVAGQPFYLYGPMYPGGKAFNANAFTYPSLVPAGCIVGVDFPCAPASQGDMPRNALRGFGATQWDFAVHRDFPIHESVRLQFRAEIFNLLNHPNFGPPSGTIATSGVPNPQFGLPSATLGQSLAGSVAGIGGFDPLYQLGGPRSIQFALKLFF